MELVQAVTYAHIGQCSSPMNQLLTLLGYVHVAFQPFFVNMVAMYFIPVRVRDQIRTTVNTVCGMAALAMLIKLYPFEWARTCVKGYEGFCGPVACSLKGDWHINWQLPLNGLMSHDPGSLFPFFPWGLHGFAYFAASFVMPFLYGSWRFVGFHLLVGPILADILTRHPNEHAAVWCLLSIGLCISVIKTPLRRHLRVERWPLYPTLALTASWHVLAEDFVVNHAEEASNDADIDPRKTSPGRGRRSKRQKDDRRA
jgi:hypothetical protein